MRKRYHSIRVVRRSTNGSNGGVRTIPLGWIDKKGCYRSKKPALITKDLVGCISRADDYTDLLADMHPEYTFNVVVIREFK